MLKYFKPIAPSARTGTPLKCGTTAERRGNGSNIYKRKYLNDQKSANTSEKSNHVEKQNETDIYPPPKRLKTEAFQHPPTAPKLSCGLQWRKISAEKLDCDYVQLYGKRDVSELYAECEKSLQYFTGELTKVQVYGKWHNIPRKQV